MTLGSGEGSNAAGPNVGPREYAEQLVQSYETALTQVVDTAYPEQKEKPLTQVFPQPTQPRNAAQSPNWSAEQEENVRSIVEQFGIGRESDRTIGELGLPGPACAIVEGGLLHTKMQTELELVLGDPDNVAAIVISATPNRKTTPEEQAFAEASFGAGAVPKTEYDGARILAEHLRDFHALPQPEVMQASYAVEPGHAVGAEPTEQVQRLGTVTQKGISKDVILLRIDRQDTPGGPKAYINQPEPGDVMGIVSNILKQDGNTTTPIAFVTSATYEGSRTIQAARIGLENGRVMGVATYGSEHLARVKGEARVAPVAVNQLPGELHVIAESIASLKETLAK